MIRSSLILIGLLLFTLTLRAQAPSQTWGSFNGDPLAQLLPNGRDILLQADFIYTDQYGIIWIAPKGMTSDGASIPQVFWSFVGGPLDKNYRNAAIIHDEYCDTHERSWQATDLAFYDAMRCGGVSEAKAKLMYYAVYHFGPHWGPGALPSTQAPSQNSKIPHSHTMTTQDILSTESIQQAPTNPSDVLHWIETQKPSLDQIQDTAPASLSSAPTE